MKNITVKIKQLQKLMNLPYPVLSVYLGTAEKKTFHANVVVSQFHSLIHQSLTKDEQKKFKKDIDRIISFLKEQYDSRGKRSIVFFSAGEKLFEVLEFEFYLPPLCVILHTPYLKPILEALDTYTKYLVLLVDHKKARLFTVHLGEIEEHKDVFNGNVPQKVRANEEHYYGRSNKIFRHIEDHLHRHLQFIAEVINDFVKDKNIHFIILGGHREIFKKIKYYLPSHLQKLVLGQFDTELNVPLNTVFLKSKKIAEQIEQEKLGREVNLK
jgi:hypothetical protein